MRFRKILSALLLTIMTLALLTACGGSTPAATPSGDSGASGTETQNGGVTAQGTQQEQKPRSESILRFLLSRFKVRT